MALLNALGIDAERGSTHRRRHSRLAGGGNSGSPFDAYYLSRTPSFRAPHASFQEIEELLSVRGVTPDIFYGTWVAAGNGNADTNALVRRPGLNDCLTVYGSMGGVDVNTAEPAVLTAAGVNPAVIAAVEARRASGQPSQDMMEMAQSMGRGRWPAGGRQHHRHLPFDGAHASAQRRALRHAAHGGRASEVCAVRIGRSPYYVLRWYDTAWSY
ncbi:MAG: hypothetical protein WDO73_33320 [Ignavibacteriota bacterium]